MLISDRLGGENVMLNLMLIYIIYKVDHFKAFFFFSSQGCPLWGDGGTPHPPHHEISVNSDSAKGALAQPHD